MRLFLNGGGCGKQTVLAYQEIHKIIDHSKPVLYVPLAMDESEHPYDDCYQWVQEEISVIHIPTIEMVRSFEELAEKDFHDYSMIFIGGGNTYKLLKGIKTTKSFEKFQKYIEDNGIIYGSSAGAVIFGKDINSIEIMDQNDVGLKDTSGFNVFQDTSLFVHYTNYRSKYTEEENKHLTEQYTNFIVDYTKKHEKVIAYPEENTIFFDGEKIQMIGKSPYYLFENGEKEIIE